MSPILNRREAIAALASTAALPLLNACGGNSSTSAPVATSNGEKDALALLDSIGENYVRFAPESATSLGIDTGARAALRSQLADRSADGQRRSPNRCGRISSAPRRSICPALDHATRTSVEVVRSAYQPPLDGFALPYGDITVGSWRNTPYVVIQNVGAYLDIPRFLDSDHSIENAADAEAYLARLQSYAKQLDGERGRIEAARGKGLVPPAFLIDKALSQMRLSAKNARDGGSMVESIERARTRNRSPATGPSRAKRSPRRKSRPRSIARSPNSRPQRKAATDDAGMWARPNGDEFYRWALKASTTTSMTPDEVHDMGQRELKDLQSQMDAIMKRPGLHHRHRRRAHEGDRERPQATSSPKATRAGPRSWRSSRSA